MFVFVHTMNDLERSSEGIHPKPESSDEIRIVAMPNEIHIQSKQNSYSSDKYKMVSLQKKIKSKNARSLSIHQCLSSFLRYNDIHKMISYMR